MAITRMQYNATCSGGMTMTYGDYNHMCMRKATKSKILERNVRLNKMMGGFNAGEDYLALKVPCLKEPDCDRHGVAHSGPCYEPCTNGFERNGPWCVGYMYYEPYCETKDLVEGGEQCTFQGTTTYMEQLKTMGTHKSKHGRFGPSYRKYGYYPI